MITVHVIQASGSTLEEAMANLAKALGGPGDSGLLGLDRTPREIPAGRPAAPKNRSWAKNPENVLLTVRRDLMSQRERILAGTPRRELLREIDYTIDQLDNALAER